MIVHKSLCNQDIKLAKAVWALLEIMYIGLQQPVIVDQSALPKVETTNRTFYMFSLEANLRGKVLPNNKTPQSA